MQTVSIPKINGGTKSTRDSIISLLSEKWPMNAKEICGRLSREHGFEGTYQAAHKAIMQALAEGVVVRDGKGYMLSEHWISSIKNYGADLESTYLKKEYNLAELVEKDVANITFKYLISMARFIINYYTRYPNPKNQPMIIHWRHMWPLITLSKEEYVTTKEFCEKFGGYTLTCFDNPLDNLSTEAFKKYNCKIKVNPVFRFDPDVMVYGDYVAYIYFGDAVKLWDDICGKIKTAEDIDLVEFYKVMLESEIEVNVVVVKNAKVAEEIRRRTLAEFGVNKK
ncbi:MAG: hypothetical protein V1676_02595 [Candidatus Diapherotrites archaeon]